MYRVTCRAVRLWLQTPDDLTPADARALEEHLLHCSSCRETREWQVTMDQRIREALDRAVGSTSVRSQVLAHLPATKHAPPSQPPAIPARRRRSARRVWRPLLWAPVMAGVGFIALAAAVLAPQVFPGSERRVTTAGASWRLVRANVAYPFTTDLFRPDHLLAGAWGRVYESWNGGNSWRPLAPLPPHLRIQALAFDSRRPNRYLVATSHSVFLSTDAGRHWVMTASSMPGARNMFLQADPHTPGTFYLGPSILWKSADHGQSWIRAGVGRVFAPYGIQQLAIAPDGTLFTAIWGGGVAVSHDGGRSWQRRARGLTRNVMDVIAPSSRILWAATDRGVFSSTDGGLQWRSIPKLPSFRVTSVLAGSNYVLAGGDGALYRSIDEGKRWELSMRGLPLDPYVATLIADPHHPGRVFASLNSDGIFRSDDAGGHWTAVDAGLPLNGKADPSYPVLFRRGGALSSTDSHGTDPQVLTVDEDVALAAQSPDGAAAAYVAARSGAWMVRVVSPGAAARTLAEGTGDVPQLRWSPTSALLAIIQRGAVTVTNLARGTHSWSFPPEDTLLGWSTGGHSLLSWRRADGRIYFRSWTTGQPALLGPARYPVAPLPAPDGTHLAFVSADHLYVGSWYKGARAVAPVTAGCRLTNWSDDSTRLLLTCGDEVDIRTTTGRSLTRAPLPSNAAWVPGSDTDLLFFRDGALWRWIPSSGSFKIVPHAEPAQP